MMLLFRNDDGVSSVCISDITFAGRGKDVKMRLAAAEGAIPPHVTILAAGAASSLKPTRCSTVFGLGPMFAATAATVYRTHRCAWWGRSVLVVVYGVAPAVVDPANSDRRDSP